MAMKDAVSFSGEEFIHGDDHLFIVVFDLLQVAKLPFDGRFTAQTVTYLYVFLFVLLLGNKVDLYLIDGANGYFFTSSGFADFSYVPHRVDKGAAQIPLPSGIVSVPS